MAVKRPSNNKGKKLTIRHGRQYLYCGEWYFARELATLCSVSISSIQSLWTRKHKLKGNLIVDRRAV